jgi:hypothetical protein
MENWRQQAAELGASAGILAGGDGSARKKKGVTNHTDGASTASVKLRWSIGKTRRRGTSKSCAQEGTWIGPLNQQEATLELNKLTFWLP